MSLHPSSPPSLSIDFSEKTYFRFRSKNGPESPDSDGRRALRCRYALARLPTQAVKQCKRPAPTGRLPDTVTVRAPFPIRAQPTSTAEYAALHRARWFILLWGKVWAPKGKMGSFIAIFSKLRGWLWGLPMPTDSYRWVATVVAGGATLNTARHQALEDRNQTETRLVLAT